MKVLVYYKLIITLNNNNTNILNNINQNTCKLVLMG